MVATAWGAWCKNEWPGLTDADVSAVLWNCTAFPLGSLEQVEAQFLAARDNSGGNAETAIAQAHARTDEVMDELRRQGKR